MLVTPSWLADRLAEPDLVVVDLRWDEQGRGRTRYDEGHIPAAHFLDWATDIVDPGHRVAFMLAAPERFAAALERCGVSDDTVLVAYADAGHSGPFRLWWGCRVYGHDGQVRILDGGLEAWLEDGRPLTREAPRTRRGSWTPRLRAEHVADAVDVRNAREDPDAVILDSRDPELYRGDAVWFETGPVPAGPDGVASTPRGDLRAGHVPWASSLPWRQLYDEELRMKSPEELAALFAAYGATPERRVITYCGVGISASALVYALERAGVGGAAVYDAGWDEWGRDAELPVARG